MNFLTIPFPVLQPRPYHRSFVSYDISYVQPTTYSCNMFVGSEATAFCTEIPQATRLLSFVSGEKVTLACRHCLQDVYAFQALRVLVLGIHRSGLTESKLQRGVEHRGTHAYSLLLQVPCAAYDMPIPDGLYKSQMRKTKCLSTFPTVLWTHKLKQGPSDRTLKSLGGCRFLESAPSWRVHVRG